MTTEQAKTLSEKAITRLMEALERGQSDALKSYLSAMSRFHRYSWGNVLMICSQRPDATHVAGFHTWLKMRRYVRKGEKGIVILAPMVGRKKTDDTLTEDAQTRLYGFRAAHVFDVSQTDGDALPEFATIKGDPKDYAERLEDFVTSQGIALEYDSGIAPAKGLSSGGKITLLPDLSAAERFATLIHETAHELLHRGDRRMQTTRTVRETESEAVAFVICEAVGLDTNTASADYIRLYSGDKVTLAESLHFIQSTAAVILTAITAEGDAAS
ncbi:MAG: ssDNA-binding domain-containing protein [Acidobacteriia bacterium]|nr:ssDNA-binding domain-containing protein [Terriglobia bacterium]